MSNVPPGLVVLYRWRLRVGTEAAFAGAWEQATRALLERGSLGSRLHRGNDGLWYGYAQWPDAESRMRAFDDASSDEASYRRMGECVSERFPDVLLTTVADLLRPLSGGDR